MLYFIKTQILKSDDGWFVTLIDQIKGKISGTHFPSISDDTFRLKSRSLCKNTVPTTIFTLLKQNINRFSRLNLFDF